MKVLSIISNGSGHRATYKDDKGEIIVKRFPLETTEACIFAYDPVKQAPPPASAPQGGDNQGGQQNGGSGQSASSGNGLERLNTLREKAKGYGLKPLNVSADALEAMIKEHEAKQAQGGGQP